MKRTAMLFSIALAVAMTAAAATRPRAATAGNGTWDSGSYQYDSLGNITNIGTDTYAYDTAQRLVSGTADVQRTQQMNEQHYGYDAFGNRIAALRASGSKNCVNNTPCEVAVSIDPATNHLVSDGAVYDADGNLVAWGVAHYEYDSLNMIVHETEGTNDFQFVYTPDEERIAVDRNGSWTWSVRGADKQLLREFTSADAAGAPGSQGWAWKQDYVSRGGALTATVQQSGQSTATTHFHLDHLGTPRLVTDDHGIAVAVHAYYPFGAELDLAPREHPEESRKFTGHERDSTGDIYALDYMHARYYSGSVGRFLSADPAPGDPYTPQSWNRYSYVRNNGVGAVDPDGRDVLALAFVDYKAKAFGIHVPFTGHAAVVTIDSRGHTRMYEYGRYDHPQERGVVHRQGVPDVTMKGGRPTQASMQRLMQSIASHEHNYVGKIEGAYFKTGDKGTNQAIGYAEAKEAKNNDPNRPSYNTGITGDANNCATFTRDTVGAAGVNTSAASSDIKPTSTLQDLQKNANVVIEYDADSKKLQQTPPLK